MRPIAVVDTDVVSYLAKGDSRGSLYTQDLAGKNLCISFQTVAELRLWIIVRRLGKSRVGSLEQLLRRFVVLPYNSAMADEWARITATRRQLGKPIDCGDAWIAAAAVLHDAVLITHNGRHFSDVEGLKLISHNSFSQ